MNAITNKEKDAVLMGAARRAMRFWGLTDEQAETLTAVSAARFDAAGNKRIVMQYGITEDSRERLKQVTSLYRELHASFGDGVADTWLTAPNQATVFEGHTPLGFILQDPEAGMFLTISHLRSRSQGC